MNPNCENSVVDFISVGFPVHNGEKYIFNAINSILSQSYKHFELIISDNASTDSTSEICKEFARRDSRVIYYRQESNIGANKNFKFTLNKAKYEYFVWMAHDDEWHPKYIESCILALNEDSAASIVFCEYYVKNLITGKLIRHRSSCSNSLNKRTRYITRLLNPMPSIVYGVFRTKVIKEISIEDFDYADLHLTHILAIDYVVKIIPQALFITGTEGSNGLYSLSSKKYISPSQYLAKTRNLLNKNFSWPVALILFFLTRYICLKNTSIFNKMIKNGQRFEI